MLHHPSSVTYMLLLSRVWRVLWAPLASLAPAVILYVPHMSSHVPSFMWLLPGFLAMMEWSFVLFLSIRDPRVTKEVEGRRCVALFWWILFCLYCEHRIGYLVWRQHTAQPPLPSGLFISYCVPLFVVTLTVTLSCCGNPVRVINVGCLLLSSFLRGLLSAHTQG